jgi:hypothetical protein
MGWRGRGANRGAGGFGGWCRPFFQEAEVDLFRGGTGGDERRQAYLGPRARAAPGDMMIDWVSSRLRGDAAAQSIEAVRLALRGRAGSG